jgi:hypothetical protein
MTVAGVRKYVEFHQLEPRKVGRFPATFEIPAEVKLGGTAKQVLYRSDKLNPTTGADEGVIDYFHDHKDGVRIYRTDAHFGGQARRVPNWIRNVKALVRLGDCLGFTYADEDGYEVRAKGKKPYPELYCIPSGKALLVVQGKRRVLAIIWGGRLGVEARGIVN